MGFISDNLDGTWMTTAPKGTSGLTVADLSAILDSIPPIPRDVFFFDGTLDEFRRYLAGTGVAIRNNVVAPDLPLLGWIDSLDGLRCWDFDGKVWIGSTRDIREAREGRLPFKAIGKGPAT